MAVAGRSWLRELRVGSVAPTLGCRENVVSDTLQEGLNVPR